MPIKHFTANHNARPHKTVLMSLIPLPGPPALVLLALLLADLLSRPLFAHVQRIRPYAQIPFYWQLNNKPLLLLGGSDDDNLFQWPTEELREQLDTLRTAGGNYIRNTMSDRRDKGFEVYPFKKRDDDKYDLDRWNEDYWTRFESMLRLTAEREIVVQIEVWDRFDFSQRNNQAVLRHQQRFVEKLLSYTLNYGHVLYCIENETSADEAWGAYWADFIRRRARDAGADVSITEMWDDWNLKGPHHRRTLEDPERYDFLDVSQNNHQQGQRHWDDFQWLRRYVSKRPRPINTVKTYGADDNKFRHTDQDGIERFWRHLIGGAASVRFHRPTSGLGLSPKSVATIQAARKLESLIPLWDVTPANHLLGARQEDEAYLAARPGTAYALYFPRGGSVTLQLGDSADLYTLQWIDISTGDWGKRSPLSGSGTVTISAPEPTNWVAAIQPPPPALTIPPEKRGGSPFLREPGQNRETFE